MTPSLTDANPQGDTAAPFEAPLEVHLPGYQPTRILPEGRCGQRLLATRKRDGEQVVLHAVRRSLRRGMGGLGTGRTSRDARRFHELVAPVRSLESNHVTPIENVVADACGYHWVVTPYLGTCDGLLTLDRLRRLKDSGQFCEHETERAVEHLLGASEVAHGRGLAHGRIAADEVLVNRHGSLVVELYGLARRLAAPRDTACPTREELRSIAELAYTMLTGTLEAPEPYIPAGRIVKKLSPVWDAWLAYALDPARGFDTAAAALAALPSRGDGPPKPEGKSDTKPGHKGGDDAAGPKPTVRKVSLAGMAGWRSKASGKSQD